LTLHNIVSCLPIDIDEQYFGIEKHKHQLVQVKLDGKHLVVFIVFTIIGPNTELEISS